MELNPFKAAFQLVANEQKKLSSKTEKLYLEVIEQTEGEIGKALDQLQSGDSNGPASQCILEELNAKLTEINGQLGRQLDQLNDAEEQLELEFQNYEKLVTESFYPDISKPCREIKFDTDTINKIIVSHFYRQGLFDIGDYFIDEAEVQDTASLKSSFEEMRQILSAMKTRDLKPALNWATINRDKLKEIGSDFELKLHSLQFVKILKRGKDSNREAIQYSRDFLAPFVSNHDEAKFKKLMGCLVYIGKLDNCPYTEFLSTLTSEWDKLVEEFTGLFCNLLGQSDKSPLSVTVAAGVQHLSSVLKTMADMGEQWNSVEQLSVNVDLDKEFQFHSSFVCSISMDESAYGNPPLMLPPCNHVLSLNSIRKLPVKQNRTFSCPYCRAEINLFGCRLLFI